MVVAVVVVHVVMVGAIRFVVRVQRFQFVPVDDVANVDVHIIVDDRNVNLAVQCVDIVRNVFVVVAFDNDRRFVFDIVGNVDDIANVVVQSNDIAIVAIDQIVVDVRNIDFVDLNVVDIDNVENIGFQFVQFVDQFRDIFVVVDQFRDVFQFVNVVRDIFQFVDVVVDIVVDVDNIGFVVVGFDIDNRNIRIVRVVVVDVDNIANVPDVGNVRIVGNDIANKSNVRNIGIVANNVADIPNVRNVGIVGNDVANVPNIANVGNIVVVVVDIANVGHVGNIVVVVHDVRNVRNVPDVRIVAIVVVFDNYVVDVANVPDVRDVRYIGNVGYIRNVCYIRNVRYIANKSNVANVANVGHIVVDVRYYGIGNADIRIFRRFATDWSAASGRGVRAVDMDVVFRDMVNNPAGRKWGSVELNGTGTPGNVGLRPDARNDRTGMSPGYCGGIVGAANISNNRNSENTPDRANYAVAG